MSSARDQLAAGAAAAAFAGWFVAGVLTNHPAQGYDRVRQHIGGLATLVPNWRFFAPTPAVHDYHVLYRVQTVGGARSAWQDLQFRPPGRWWRAVLNPHKRRVKAMHDILGRLTTALQRFPVAAVQRTDAYAFLVDVVGRAVRRGSVPGDPAHGFQLAVVRFAGFDESDEPDYLLLSPYLPLG